ncbi:MAG: roadblock/LC7 domain-containing protein [Armatimonadota bacterium]|jgi:predicted regulator of Ras-like GTPase activity (Roadblock/LC7/MglB family)
MERGTAEQSNLDLIRRYGEEIRRDSDSLVFALLADAFRDGGMLSEAEEVCRKGIEQHPSYATARVVMGQIQEDMGDAEAAEREYEAALSLDPQNIMARMSLGKVLLREDRRAAARAHFEHVLFLNATDAEARRLLEVAEGRRPMPTQLRKADIQDAPPRATPTEPEEEEEASEEPSVSGRRTSVGDIEATLQGLNGVPGVLAAMLVGNDGLLIASELNTAVDEEAFGALVSEIGDAMARCARRMGMGEFERSVVEGAAGRMVLRRADSRVLVVATEHGVRLGMVNMLLDRGADRLRTLASSTA